MNSNVGVTEFLMRGPKVGFSACWCQKKSVEYETECRHVVVQRDKQDLIIIIVDTGCSSCLNVPRVQCTEENEAWCQWGAA